MTHKNLPVDNPHLTAHQREIVGLAANGKKYKDIAVIMRVEKSTITNTVRQARMKAAEMEGKVVESDTKSGNGFNEVIDLSKVFALSPAFLEMHHFHVKTEDKDGNITLIGMFASLYCAAHTAHFGGVKGCYVLDTETGWVYEGGELTLERIPRPKAPLANNEGDAWLA